MQGRTHCHRNQLRTVLLLIVPSGLVLAMGGLIGGWVGLVVGGGVALVVSSVAYFGSSRIALRSVQARPVSEAEHPELCRIVRELATVMRLPIPSVYVSPVSTPNAFAVGRSPRYSAICVTRGLLGLLDERELRAVIGHELGHIASRDVLVTSVAAALASMITAVAQLAWRANLRRRGRVSVRGRRRPSVGVPLLLVLGPVAATLLRLAIHRSREYVADMTAAQVTGDPRALASALRKLGGAIRSAPPVRDPALRSVAALMIADPYREQGLPFGAGRLLSTHPRTRDRISRLERLAGSSTPPQ